MALKLKNGNKIYVVLNKDGTSLLHTKGAKVLFQTENRKYAEEVARGNSGVAVLAEEAITILLRNMAKEKVTDLTNAFNR
jgi:hypothetical protein